MKMFKYLTYHQLIEFRLTAIQVLVNCLSFLKRSNKIRVFRILLNALKSSSQKLQETTYHCLKLNKTKLTNYQMKMVNKIK